jgi:putative phosphoribosyl transferase
MGMAPDSEARTTITPVEVPVGSHFLRGDLGVPPMPKGLVLFAHGSGSSRHSPRNQFVARVLRQEGLATLLIDLLTPEEDLVDVETAEFRFDIDMLGQRVITIVDWLHERGGTAALPIGLFGASTGAAAALMAAAARPAVVEAVVSRGGRPDLAGDALPTVAAPTLLVVGGDDEEVIELNREAMAQMHGPVHIEIVPGATHLFEEPGTLEAVADMAAAWFVTAFSEQAGRPNRAGVPARH